MSGRYPSEVELDHIEHWDGSLKELIEFIQSIWEYEPPILRVGRDHIHRKKCYKLEIHTWGWSGNEDIVEALRMTMFWFTYWQRSDRGGHFYFEISAWAIDGTDSESAKQLKWGNPRGKDKAAS